MSRLYGRPFYKVYRLYEEPTDWFYIKNISGESGDLNISSSGYLPFCVEWSFDKTNWTLMEGDWFDTIDDNQTIYLRSTDGWSKNENNRRFLNIGFEAEVGGNLETLVNWKNYGSNLTVPDHCFRQMFDQNTYNIKDASNLTSGNIKNVGYNSFYCMFQFCENLENIGDFSSIQKVGNNGMYYMFNGCHNLGNAIDLSNVTEITEYSLNYLYYGCYNIGEVTVPKLSEWNTNNTQQWLSGTGNNVQSKTAYVPAGVTIPQNESGVPSGWTRVEYQN